MRTLKLRRNIRVSERLVQEPYLRSASSVTPVQSPLISLGQAPPPSQFRVRRSHAVRAVCLSAATDSPL